MSRVMVPVYLDDEHIGDLPVVVPGEIAQHGHFLGRPETPAEEEIRLATGAMPEASIGWHTHLVDDFQHSAQPWHEVSTP